MRPLWNADRISEKGEGGVKPTILAGVTPPVVAYVLYHHFTG